ncbi:MAG: nitrilase family protein [Pirellulales bacterium]
MRILRVAATQFQHALGDKAANLDIIAKMSQKAAQQGVQLIAFPECCISGYWHLRKLSREAFFAQAEAVPSGPSSQRLLEIAKANNLSVGAGLVELGSDGKAYNSYVVAMPNGKFACHRKLHVFVHPDLSPGDSYTVFESPEGVKVGILICYDNNIVENARMTALAGAEVLLSPHQTGGCKSGSPFAMTAVDWSLWENRHEQPEKLREEFQGVKGRGWITRWLPSRAHDNGMFVVFSNGVGADDDEVRTGNAMVLDCYGRTLAESTAIHDDLVIADLDLSLRDRCTGVRWMKARRPELYGPLALPTGNEQPTRAVRFEFGGE